MKTTLSRLRPIWRRWTLDSARTGCRLNSVFERYFSYSDVAGRFFPIYFSRLAKTLAALSIGLTPAMATAHHSTAFYSDEVIELEGELVSIKWRNPHVVWQMQVVNDAGEEELWSMEGASTYPLKRAGVTRDLFVIGDRIKVAGQKSKREQNVMLATNMLLPGGRELLLWGNIAARFGDASKLVDAASEMKGLFRVWSTPSELFRIIQKRLDGLPYSEQAIASRDDWDAINNFVMRCEQEGMPRIMVNPHPFEFIDNGETITLHTELYDIYRTIHMDGSAPPADEPESHLGYSEGSWDGEALVIKTSRINWPYFDNIGTKQSADVEVIERFSLNEDQSRLNLHMMITDPFTFTEPAVVEGYWLALGEEMPPPYDCQAGRPGE